MRQAGEILELQNGWNKMSELVKKEQLLEESGYCYYFERSLYVNREQRKVISLQYIEVFSAEKLSEVINERVDSSTWTLYFVTAPSDRVKRELSEELEMWIDAHFPR